MITSPIRSLIVAGALACGGVAASPGAAAAQTTYDGSWSAVIITHSGACEPTYRFGFEISDGNVFYRGDGPVNIRGQVARNGAVQVSVAAGEQRAAGSGRLFRYHGGGYWHGRGPTGACAGRWEAERRG